MSYIPNSINNTLVLVCRMIYMHTNSQNIYHDEEINFKIILFLDVKHKKTALL